MFVNLQVVLLAEFILVDLEKVRKFIFLHMFMQAKVLFKLNLNFHLQKYNLKRIKLSLSPNMTDL